MAVLFCKNTYTGHRRKKNPYATVKTPSLLSRLGQKLRFFFSKKLSLIARELLIYSLA